MKKVLIVGSAAEGTRVAEALALRGYDAKHVELVSCEDIKQVIDDTKSIRDIEPMMLSYHRLDDTCYYEKTPKQGHRRPYKFHK